MCFYVIYFILLVLSHVHKCHGSTQCSQCNMSPLTKIFIICELGTLSVLLASRPPTQSIPLLMTVHSGVPQTVDNGLCTVVMGGLQRRLGSTDRVDGSS